MSIINRLFAVQGCPLRLDLPHSNEHVYVDANFYWNSLLLYSIVLDRHNLTEQQWNTPVGKNSLVQVR